MMPHMLFHPCETYMDNPGHFQWEILHFNGHMPLNFDLIWSFANPLKFYLVCLKVFLIIQSLKPNLSNQYGWTISVGYHMCCLFSLHAIARSNQGLYLSFKWGRKMVLKIHVWTLNQQLGVIAKILYREVYPYMYKVYSA